MIASIIIDIKNKQVNRTFDYLIPEFLEGYLTAGFRVKVPFANTVRTGYVMEIKEKTDYNKNLKEIIDVIDVKRLLDEEFIEIAKYIANDNFSFYATALDNMIPQALKMKYQKIAKCINVDKLNDNLKNTFKRKEIIFDNCTKEIKKEILEEVKNGNIILDTKLKRNLEEKVIKYVHLENNLIETKSKQGKLVVDYLTEIEEDIAQDILLEDCGIGKSVLKTLESLNIISIYEVEINNYNDNILIQEDKKIELNEKQLKVYNSIDYEKSKTYLLHGVTGSGKTEIYMRWINDILKLDKGAIMLVPEISLTPQITQILKARFKGDIAIIHSRLTIREKYNAWKKILNQEVKIVVGARSAIFSPIKNLGIIIIDEEHETSYKQQNNPRYDAIEMAKLRSKYHNIPLILGSATPRVVDYYYATNGEYKLLSLPTRANGKDMPNVEIVDMANELISGNKTVLSRKLQKSLKENYENNKQSILFLNRRGYSTFVMCRSCGEAIKCPNCDVSLTYHKNIDILKCHYCGYNTVNVKQCSKCGSDKIRFVGSGTEKIIEAVNNLIPDARILRLDSDTVNSIVDYENAYNKFKNHEADVLIGTQMITKGFDFKDVTLVGVVNADLALNYPTIDASEIAFDLICQVSGRAGRSDIDGNVIIQTYNPNHYVIDACKNHDYDKFYRKEIFYRQAQMLPPFSDYIEIQVSSIDKNKAYDEALKIKKNLDLVAKNSIILGPIEAAIFKKNNVYYYNIQVQIQEDIVYDKIKYLYPYYQNNKDIVLNIKRM